MQIAVPGSVALSLAFAVSALAQSSSLCRASDSYCAEVQRTTSDQRVAAALAWIQQNDAAAIRELIALTEIPAPPFKEEVRGRAFAQKLRESGADSVWTDEIGNVIGLRRGTRRQRVLGIGGHLDTVFPEGTDVRVQQRGDTLYAPGVGDNTRGLIGMLQVLRALAAANLRTEADVLFIGTVGEEGLGDLRGVKHLFREGGPRMDSFIAVDGSDANITHRGLGSRRYRVTFTGPGGHSWSEFGRANPLHAVGRAIHLFDDVAAAFTASGEKTSYNVGRTGGGTSVNAIPFDAWIEVDMRSENNARLLQIDSMFKAAVRTALSEQNRLVRHGNPLTVEVKLVGDRPSGAVAADAPLVRRALAAARHLGAEPELESSSTDANVPIARGIPAITIGSGGVGGNAHAPDEWWLNRDGARGIQRVLVTLLLEAGLGR
jgi:tripeptide aminopeptidase